MWSSGEGRGTDQGTAVDGGRQMVSLPGGKEIWKENGSTFPSMHRIPLPTLRNSEETFRVSGSSLIREKVGDRDRRGWVEKEGREETLMFGYIYIFGEKEFIYPMIFSPGVPGWLEDPTEGLLRGCMLIAFFPDLRSVPQLCTFLLNKDEVHVSWQSATKHYM